MSTIPFTQGAFRSSVPTTYEEFSGMNVSPLITQSGGSAPLGSGMYNLNGYDSLMSYAPGNFGATDMSGLNLSNYTASPNGIGWLGDKLSGVNSFMKNTGMIGSVDANEVKTDGWGNLALGGAAFLTNAFLGMKQYGMAKDALDMQKKQFKLNYEAQKNMTNSALQDRQTRRMQERPDLAMPVAEYMAKWGIK